MAPRVRFVRGLFFARTTRFVKICKLSTHLGFAAASTVDQPSQYGNGNSHIDDGLVVHGIRTCLPVMANSGRSLVWDLIGGQESRLSLDDSTARGLRKYFVAVSFAFNDLSGLLRLGLEPPS